ncbi:MULTISPECIES: muconolactone Delta-isomerase family protein [Actinoalloteichus]|uniref:Muconolactone delta-isomerase n=1 Tax=Actinoalloteichus fjordicus TaxID=1612552 RepID=A0AAC9PR88_9PSEU|nr:MULTISPECIES: muconolactone Delta-isomerase family protein [Actinoalloteichus]APU13581.1 muconolactone delta-isomerase [Actinoalloteichus fjordicus]APU19528.1 muconolactone delta-isomerase [Actinoalloteichus sp. GBA129-24]
MLFFCQMRWNHEGRISLDELWEIEEEETRHAQETVDSGYCVGIWKVAGQKRVLAVVDAESADDLDRSVFQLPMREYLEFEAIWPLRDYVSFAGDVENRYRPVGQEKTP